MIRPARPIDIPSLVEINDQVHQLHRAAVPGRYLDPSRDQVDAWFRDRLGDPDLAIWVADRDGVAVGYVSVRRSVGVAHVFAPARVTAYVDQLGVRADARRGGHGRALMAAAETQAGSWGAAAVTFDVQAFNGDARRFYEALGYAVTGYRMGRDLR